MSTITTTPATPSPIFHSPASPFKKQKMSITQTYYLAHKARAKLSHEAAMPDHNLRLLVGHANLLDGLMLELADAEREQESWFNNSVRSASQPEKATADDRHIQWADAIPEEDEEEDDYYEDDSASSDDDSDISDDEDTEEDTEMADALPLRRVSSHHHHHSSNNKTPTSPRMEIVEIDMEDYDYEEAVEEEEDYAQLTLTRSPSHHSSVSSPPELEHDSDDSSEDESMPPSPPTTLIPSFAVGDSHDQNHHTTTTTTNNINTSAITKQQKESEEDDQSAAAAAVEELYDDSIHYMPSRNPARLVSAISVY
ncbi:hypothetical protein BD289DRAFT_480587 [Coniella lustricola]|uniref:Protein ECM13 n=1 Tax=Coniella lustricola TaxID=2025994 RepID=A0A2T3AF85_9PEZI|nr:hypothetical protein BD289DRAFT_480587 [Coniella lustricola]